MVERAVDANPVPATFVDGATEVTLSIARRQYQSPEEESAGLASGTKRRWLVPARRMATKALAQPAVGHIVYVGTFVERVIVAVPGYAGGEIVRWDVETEGVG